MAYTNNNGQTRVGVRIVPLSVVIPTISALLDSYSGASAAYSLRKLKSSYTGSAIRVRRSSDNTELNIGFDSVGNLDTYALSSFVGTGNGFVTTWYDQSGSGNNATQTTSSSQPRIVNAGIIETVGGKPAVRWLVTGGLEMVLSMNTSLSNVRSVFLNITYLSGIARVPLLGHTTAYDYHSDADVYLSSQYAANYVKNGSNYINGVSKTLATFVKSSSNSLITMIHTSASGNVNQISSDRNIGRWDWSFFTGYFSEIILYSSDQTTNRINIESNMNTYYSVYPNPTSVWNLLNAVYSADTTSLPSLKTSLVAAYNGESNTNDSFGTNNGTAVGGLTYTAGKIGNAFVGNGTTSYIEVGDKFDLGLSSWSYNIWFYPTNLSFNRTLFSKSAWASGGGRYSLYLSSALMVFDLTFSDGNYISIRDNSTVLPGSQWFNITIVIDRADKIKIYYNGVLSTNVVNLGSVNNNLIPYINDNLNNTRPFRIGCGSGTDGYNPETPTRFAQGSIDSFNIWNKVLTQAEITELYNSGNGAQYIGDNFYKPTTNDALNTYNGTAQGGLTYGVGKVGTAFQFNGTNAHVSFPAGSFNSLTTDFSVSAWVYLPSGYNSTNNCPIFSNMSAPGWFETPGGFWLRFAGTTIQLAIGGKLNPTFLNYDIVSDNLLGTWIHVVAVRKNNTSSKIYINNVLKTSNTDTVNPVYYTGVNLTTPTIGNVKMPNGVQNGYYAYNGSKIDAVGIWNKELTATEVTELYNSGNGKQYPN